MARLGTGVQRLTLAAWMVLAAAGVIVLCAPEAVTPESYAVTRHADDEDGGEGDREAARAVLDPTEWGSDHVGEPLPMYVDSGECLFCHRNDIGATWSTNDRHSRTIRIIADDPEAHEALAEAFPKQAEEAELVLGLEPHVAFLKRAEAYGKMDLLSIGATRRPGRRVRLERGDEAHWQTNEFNENCAGCHTTAVDPETLAYATVSLDCFSCHGDGPLEHANEPELMTLAEARHDPPEVVTSICASCHVRFGESKSSGRPYPNNFVPGDNLFRDYQYDFDLADEEGINPSDRHVLANVRDVVVYGKEAMTCLSCHDVHGNSTKRHAELPDSAYCAICHEPGEPKTKHKTYDVHSERCRY